MLFVHSHSGIILAVRVKMGTAVTYNILTISTFSSEVFQFVVICLNPSQDGGNKKTKTPQKAVHEL
jgi:hypothetical protein